MVLPPGAFSWIITAAINLSEAPAELFEEEVVSTSQRTKNSLKTHCESASDHEL